MDDVVSVAAAAGVEGRPPEGDDDEAAVVVSGVGASESVGEPLAPLLPVVRAGFFLPIDRGMNMLAKGEGEKGRSRSSLLRFRDIRARLLRLAVACSQRHETSARPHSAFS